MYSESFTYFYVNVSMNIYLLNQNKGYFILRVLAKKKQKTKNTKNRYTLRSMILKSL